MKPVIEGAPTLRSVDTKLAPQVRVAPFRGSYATMGPLASE